jgi:aspartyl-tRNA(Asn)/glutamyl-tRNA(Gln) amidotransferase subunit B
MPGLVSQKLLVGLEIHVQLATRTKMFTRVGSPAHPDFESAEPNTLLDPVVLGLPGALPVMNREAIDMAIRVGLALNCSIAQSTKWDRKSYYYPDLPKAYQISQYDMPLCFDGSCEFSYEDHAQKLHTKNVGIVRAHLEEDAGKLLHEAPGGERIDFSIVDFNRAGTPLLEIVTHPDFETAGEVVAFAQHLRQICRHLEVSHGVMQKGHMRFEPNINLHLTMDDGTTVETPIIEIKNLNSFRALKGAIEYEAANQAQRYLDDGKVMGPGAKTTRGWDDTKEITFIQREKEDAHDYRYFPDPDLLPVTIEESYCDSLRAQLPELPSDRQHRLEHDFALSTKEASAIVDDHEVAEFFDACVESITALGIEHGAAGKQASKMLLQAGAKRANEQHVLISALGITPDQVAGIVVLRQQNLIGSTAADELFGMLCDSDDDAKTAADKANLLQVSDKGALQEWCQQVIDDPANAQAAQDVRGGKDAAIGRLVGGVMRLSGGKADAKGAQKMLRELLR